MESEVELIPLSSKGRLIMDTYSQQSSGSNSKNPSQELNQIQDTGQSIESLLTCGQRNSELDSNQIQDSALSIESLLTCGQRNSEFRNNAAEKEENNPMTSSLTWDYSCNYDNPQANTSSPTQDYGNELYAGNSIFPSLDIQGQQSPNHSNSRQYRLQRPNIPVKNSTLSSQGKGKVFIVKVTDSEGMKLITSPSLINKIFFDKSGPFKDIKIQDLRVNRKKQLIVVESPSLNSEFIAKLPDISRLSNFEVTCYQPNSEIFTHGVFGPIALDADIDFLQDNMQFDPPTEAFKIERMKRKNDDKIEDSLSVKLTFKDKEIPESVKICGLFYRIRPYVPLPTQCYNCQRYGHTSSSCKSQVRCLLCSGNHNKDQCTKIMIRCANCKEGHIANSKECQYMKSAKKVEEIKILEKISHSEARARVINAGRSSASQSTSQYNNEHRIYGTYSSTLPDLNEEIVPGSYSQALRNVNVRNGFNGTPLNPIIKTQHSVNARPTETIKTSKREISTQTERIDHNNMMVDTVFFQKLRNFILEIMSTNLNNETNSSKLILADSAIRNCFGVDLRESKGQSTSVSHAGTNEETSKKSSSDHKRKRKGSVLELNDSSPDERSVLSSNYATESDTNDSIWKTVEKKQVKRKGNKKHKRNKRSEDKKGGSSKS